MRFFAGRNKQQDPSSGTIHRAGLLTALPSLSRNSRGHFFGVLAGSLLVCLSVFGTLENRRTDGQLETESFSFQIGTSNLHAQDENRVFLPWLAQKDTTPIAPLPSAPSGRTTSIVFEGDRAFAGVGWQVWAFDIATPAIVLPIQSSVDLGAETVAMIIDPQNELLYAAAGNTIYTLSTAAQNTLVVQHSLGLPSPIQDMERVGDSLLVSSDLEGSGFYRISITNASRPRLTTLPSALIDSLGPLRQIEVDDAQSTVFLSKSTGTLCSLPVAAIAEESTEPSCASTSAEGSPDDQDSLAMVLLGEDPDGANPLWPFVTSERGAWARYEASMEDGDSHYGVKGAGTGRGPAGIRALVQFGTMVYMASPDGLWVSSSVEDPMGAATLVVPVDGGLSSLVLDAERGRLYAGGESTQFIVFDLTDQARPSDLGRYQKITGVEKLVGSSDHLFYLQDDPAQFAVLKSVPPAGGGAGRSLQRVGRYALTAEGVTSEQIQFVGDPRRRYAYLLYYDALQVMDASSPNQPEPAHLLEMPAGTAMDMDGDYLYVAGDGLKVLDIKDPRNPLLQGRAFRGGQAQAIAVSGTNAFIAQKEPIGQRPISLLVYSFANRNAPVEVGAIGDIGTTLDLAAKGDQIYQLFDRYPLYGVQSFALRNGTQPQRLEGPGAFVTEGRVTSMHLAGDRLFVAEESYFDRRSRQQKGNTGLHILDISNANAIQPLSFMPFESVIKDIAMLEGVLHVALGEAGVEVLDLP